MLLPRLPLSVPWGRFLVISRHLQPESQNLDSDSVLPDASKSEISRWSSQRLSGKWQGRTFPHRLSFSLLPSWLSKRDWTSALVFWGAPIFNGAGALVWTSVRLVLHLDIPSFCLGKVGVYYLCPQPETRFCCKVLKPLAPAVPAEKSVHFCGPHTRLEPHDANSMQDNPPLMTVNGLEQRSLWATLLAWWVSSALVSGLLSYDNPLPTYPSTSS